jgi:hypothetical protein
MTLRSDAVVKISLKDFHIATSTLKTSASSCPMAPTPGSLGFAW